MNMSAMIRNIRTFCLGFALLFTAGTNYLSAQTVTKQLYLSDGLIARSGLIRWRRLMQHWQQTVNCSKLQVQLVTNAS
jgi:hypothetical protein